MKYWPVGLLFVCLGSITNAVGIRGRRSSPIEIQNIQRNGELGEKLRREYNATRPLQSPKYHRKSDEENIHQALRVEHFQTRLDHFGTDNLTTVEFQYILRDEYFITDGPIFIFVNDGDTFTTQFIQTGLMHDIAIDLNAALVTADMRYFRSNLPTADASHENLQFLTVEQCVADIPMLINAVKVLLNSPTSRVILWGSGHGASLATWAKREYPNLIQGVWSSSGIYERTVISHAPYESLSQSIREIGGDECADTLENALDDFEYLTQTYNVWNVREALGTCNYLYTGYDEDLAIASRGLLELIHNYLDVHHFHGIKMLCDDIKVDDQTEAFEAFGRWVRHVYTEQSCLDLTYTTREWQNQQTTWDHVREFGWRSPMDISFPFDVRPQWYQRCTQLGLFPTTVNGRTLFGRLIQQEFYFIFCSNVFYDGSGSYNYLDLANAVTALNERYGGKNPAVADIIYTNGALDPYYSFGITEHSNDNSHVFNIQHYSKSADLHSESRFDAPGLRHVKQNIRSIITEWVRQGA